MPMVAVMMRVVTIAGVVPASLRGVEQHLLTAHVVDDGDNGRGIVGIELCGGGLVGGVGEDDNHFVETGVEIVDENSELGMLLTRSPSMYTWNISWFCDCTKIEGPCGGGGKVPRGFLLCVP